MKAAIVRVLLLSFVIVAMVSGCSAPTPASHSGGTTHRAKASGHAVDGARAAPALSVLLAVFSGDGGAEWKSYDRTPGVRWTASAPNEYSSGRFARAGVIELEGYSSKVIPDGKVGAEATTIRANEGISGLTLDGSASAVEMLSVKKFYAQSDYATALRAQFDNHASVTALTQRCEPEEDETTTGNAFYRIDLGNGRAVYAESYVEGGGQAGPGYTVFDFFRVDPKPRMQQLHCEQAVHR